MQAVLGSLTNLGALLLKVFCIVVPLMIILEVAREFKVLDKLTKWLYPVVRPIGFKRDSIYPLLAGVIFGLSYGGGVLIGESKSGRVSANQIFLVALFLGMFHSIFEDTLLFTSVGANGFIILGVRIAVAFVVVYMASLLLKEKGD